MEKNGPGIGEGFPIGGQQELLTEQEKNTFLKQRCRSSASRRSGSQQPYEYTGSGQLGTVNLLWHSQIFTINPTAYT